MRLADHHDMRPAETIVQRLQLHQQRIGEHRARLARQSRPD